MSKSGNTMNTSRDVQYIGRYHDTCGGCHEYIRGFQYIGGYHEYIEGCSVQRGFQ